MIAIAKIEMKPTAAETLKGVPVTTSANTPPRQASGTCAINIRVLTNDKVAAYSTAMIKSSATGNNNCQTAIGLLELAILTDPIQRNPFGELDLLGDCALCLVDGALHVAAANAESYRNVAPEAFAIDKRGTFHGLDVSYLLKLDIAARGLRDSDLANRIQSFHGISAASGP